MSLAAATRRGYLQQLPNLWGGIMSRVLFLGAPYEVPSFSERSLIECFGATGHNTGNMLIGHGLYSQLDYATIQPYRGHMTPEFITENFDQVVIAAANFLYPKFDFSYLSTMLERTDSPVFMVGLGAQLPASTSDIGDIPAGTWRLVEIAAERSRSIGVRGEFTASLLAKRGIKNVQVTGCPSLYTNLSDPARISRIDRPEHIVVNGSRNVVAHSSHPQEAKESEVRILQWAMDNEAPYVLQNEQPEMQISAGEDLAVHAQAIRSLATFFKRDINVLTDYYRTHAKLFFSIEQWFSWISRQHLSIGTRFHGNVAALLNGVPAIVVTHDSRTRELCDFAAIPSVDVSRIDRFDPAALLAESDYDRYEATLSRNTKAYRAFLDENGIRHRFATKN